MHVEKSSQQPAGQSAHFNVINPAHDAPLFSIVVLFLLYLNRQSVPKNDIIEFNYRKVCEVCFLLKHVLLFLADTFPEWTIVNSLKGVNFRRVNNTLGKIE